MIEQITKARDDASFLLADILDAHSAAIKENKLAEIILMDLINQARDIELKISRLASAVK